MVTDYSNAPFYAISGIGYGKGFTAQEAVENYVRTQLDNHKASTTIYKTKLKWERALRTGDVQAHVYKVPEGTVGFILGSGLQWVDADQVHTYATEAERVHLAETG